MVIPTTESRTQLKINLKQPFTPTLHLFPPNTKRNHRSAQIEGTLVYSDQYHLRKPLPNIKNQKKMIIFAKVTLFHQLNLYIKIRIEKFPLVRPFHTTSRRLIPFTAIAAIAKPPLATQSSSTRKNFKIYQEPDKPGR